MASEFTAKVAKGVFWSGGTQIVSRLIQFGVTMVLARLLVPEDFGLVGIAAIFMGLIGVISDLGLNSAIIRRKEVTEEHLSTAYWANLMVGVCFYLAALLLAAPAAWFFHQDVVKWIMWVSALGLLIGPLGGVQRALLIKAMDFKTLGALDIGTALMVAGFTVGMAASGLGLWSLVAGYLCAGVISTGILFYISPWKPRFRFHKQSFRELFHFGWGILGSNVLNYAAANADNFIIGKFLGPRSLAYYSFAYGLATFPHQNLTAVVTRVMFPALSELQNDDTRLKTNYLRFVRYIALLSFPLLTGLSILAPEFVRTAYGARWIPIVIPLQILCIAGLFYSVSATVGPLYMAKGRSDLLVLLGGIRLVALSLFILAGSRYGIMGVAVSVALYAVIFTYLFQRVANSLVDLKMRELLQCLYEPVMGCVIMALIMLMLRFLQAESFHLSNPGFLVLGTTVGGLAYSGFLRFWNPETTSDFMKMVRLVVRKA